MPSTEAISTAVHNAEYASEQYAKAFTRYTTATAQYDLALRSEYLRFVRALRHDASAHTEEVQVVLGTVTVEDLVALRLHRLADHFAVEVAHASA